MVNAVVQKGRFVKDRGLKRTVESLVNSSVAGDGGPLTRKGLCVVLTPTALAFSAIALMDVVSTFRGLEGSERRRWSRKGLKYCSRINKCFKLDYYSFFCQWNRELYIFLMTQMMCTHPVNCKILVAGQPFWGFCGENLGILTFHS